LPLSSLPNGKGEETKAVILAQIHIPKEWPSTCFLHDRERPMKLLKLLALNLIVLTLIATVQIEFRGRPGIDGKTLKRLDVRTITAAAKVHGKLVNTGRRVVSADGKTITIIREEHYDSGKASLTFA
jgi:hypothetical protein